MSATERAALLDGLQLYDEMNSAVDDRALEILDLRRRPATVKRRGWLVRRMLLIADLIGLMTALLLADWLVAKASQAGAVDAQAEILLFIATLPGWVVVAKLYGLYDHDEERTDHSTVDDFGGVFHMVTVCAWLFWAGSYLSGLVHPTAPKLVLFWTAAITLVPLSRAIARAFARRSVTYVQNTVIVGAGDVGQLIAKKYLQHPEYGINLVGFVDREPKERSDDLGHLSLLGTPEDLPSVIRAFDIERILISFSNESHEDEIALIKRLRGFDLQIDLVPRLFEAVAPGFSLHTVEGLPLIGLAPARLSRSSLMLKRALDLALAISGLIALGPVMALIAMAVKLDSSGPVLYKHRRVGRAGRSIEVWKFRSMGIQHCRGERYGGAAADAAFAALLDDPLRRKEFESTYKLQDDPRVTRVGAWLRRFSLDELPQLFNVVRGDLSVVGPRAITEDELSRYGADVAALLDIRPGITGYWQVSGRNSLQYIDRVRLDLAYVTGWSLGLDAKILARTFRALVGRQGAY